ncbi:MAG: biotin/lipoyl-containing protein [Granulosicoccus sp.]
MPHEVIMPALGVAQDTGLIIAWLKQSGDPVRMGDALMEVETDKAVVEVEAQADGYLTNVSAAAGDHVPVGQVVGLISKSATDVVNSDNEATAKSELQAVTHHGQSSESIPQGNPIIMPALGMTQDTGLIVAWHKHPGDSVVASDILLEVETDKSVMEIEAGHDGYVAAVLADAQQTVPVGSTIAIISSSKPDKPVSRTRFAPTVAADSDTTEVNSTTTTPSWVENSAIHTSKLVVPDIPCGQILASPKARKLAVEQGLDLEELVSHGVPQPYHVADLETLKTLGNVASSPNATVQNDTHAASTPVVLRIDMRVPANAGTEFINWLTVQKGLCIPARMTWLRYATAALRIAVNRGSDPLVVELRQARQTDGCYADADYSRLSRSLTTDDKRAPELILRDLSESRITSITSAAATAPVLTIRQEHEEYLVALDYRTDHLDENVAVNFIADFSSRLTQPLRQLL